MSTQIDQRVVEMTFDNAQFEKGIKTTLESLKSFETTLQKIPGATAGLSMIQGVANKVSFRGLSDGVQEVTAKFNVMDMVAARVLSNIAMRAIDTGARLVKSVTIDQITGGWGEYELKMGSIQTIMASTGESLATVNKYLQELNAYSDQTIYSFSDMTNNIGKFTNAGVKLEDAVAAIKGVSNVAAISGANAGEASRAMYNFSQALSAGFVKLIDWKSIENANMATVGFKNALLTTANAMGKVKKDSNGMYKVLTTNTQGRKFEQSISATKNFNDSLNYQWMTTEVLTETLNQYSTDVTRMTKAEVEAYEARLKSLGYTEEQIKAVEKLGTDATKAATEVKTFSMMIDALGEAVGSGWATTFEIVFGDFEQGKQLWTNINNVLSGVLGKIADTRNNLLRGFLGKNVYSKDFQQLKKGIKDIDGFEKKLIELGKKEGHDVDALIKRYGSFDESLKAGWVSLDMYKEALKQTGEEANGVAANMTKLGAVVKDVILGKYKNGAERVKELTKANEEYALVQALVNAKLYGYDITTGKFTEEQIKHIAYTKEQAEALRNLQKSIANSDIPYKEMLKTVEAISKGKSGREHLIDTFANVYKYLSSIVGTIQSAMEKVFDPFDAEAAFNWLRTIDAISSSTLILNERQQELIHTNAYQFFDALKDIGGIVSEVIRGAATIAIPTLEAILSISRAIYWLFAVRIRHLVVDVIHAFIDGFKMGAEGLIEAIEGFKDFGKWLDILIDDIQIFDDNFSLVTAIGKAFGKILVAALKAVLPVIKFVLTAFKLLVFSMQGLTDTGFADAIANIATTFFGWLSGLRLSEKAMNGLKRVGRGLAAIVDLLRRGILGVVKVATPILKIAGGLLLKIGEAALYVLGVVGQLFHEFKEFITGGENSAGFLNKVFGEGLTSRILSVKDALSKIKLPELNVDAGGFVDSAVGAFETLGDTIGGVFTSKDGFSFSGIFDGIGQFISDIQKAAEENTNLGDVLGGVKDKLDILDESFSNSSTFVGTLWKGLKDLIGLLKTTFTAIHDFAVKVYETFKKYLDFGGFFTDLWNNFKVLRYELKKIKDEGKSFKDTAMDVAKAFGSFFTAMGTSASGHFDFTGLVKEIQNGVTLLWDAFKTMLTGKENATIIDVFSTLFNSVTGVIAGFFNGIFSGVNTEQIETEGVTKITSVVGKVFDPINDFLNSSTQDAETIETNTTGLIEAFVLGIRNALSGLNFETVRKAAVFGALIWIVSRTLKTIKGISFATDAIDDLVQSFTGIVSGVKKVLKSTKQYIDTQTFLIIAQGILTIAGAMALLSQIDQEALFQASMSLALVLMVVSMLILAINELTKAKGSKKDVTGLSTVTEAVKEFIENVADTFNKLLKVAGLGIMIFAIAVAVSLLVKVIMQLVGFEEFVRANAKKIIAALGVVALLIAMLGAVVVIMSKLMSNAGVLGVGDALAIVAIAAAVYLIGNVMMQLMDVPWYRLFKVTAVALGVIFALALGASNMTGLGAGAALTILAMGVALNLLIGPLKTLANDIDPVALWDATEAIALLMVGIGIASRLMGNIQSFALAGAIIALAVGVNLIAKAMKSLVEIQDINALWDVFEIIVLIVGGFAAFAAVMGIISSGAPALSALLLGLAAVISSIAGIILAFGVGIALAGEGLPAFADGMVYLANAILTNAPTIIGAIVTVGIGIGTALTMMASMITLGWIGLAIGTIAIIISTIAAMEPETRDRILGIAATLFVEVMKGIFGFIDDLVETFVYGIVYLLVEAGNGLVWVVEQIIGTIISTLADGFDLLADAFGVEDIVSNPFESMMSALDEALGTTEEYFGKIHDTMFNEFGKDNWIMQAMNNFGQGAEVAAEETASCWDRVTRVTDEKVAEYKKKQRETAASFADAEFIPLTEDAVNQTESVLGHYASVLDTGLGNATDTAQTSFANLTGTVEEQVQGLYDSVTANLNPESIYGEIMNGMDINSLGPQVGDMMASLGQYMPEGITNVDWSAAGASVQEEAGKLGNESFMTGIEAKSPSKLFMRLGQYMPAGIEKVDWSGAEESVKTAATRLGQIAATSFNGPEVGQSITTAATSAVTAAGDAFANADTAQFSGAGDKAYEAYGGGIVKKSGQMKKELSVAMLAAVKGASAYIARFRTLGEQAGIGFINGMRSKLSAAAKAGADIARTALNAVQTTQDSASPSKKFAKLGADGSQGYVNGLLSLKNTVANAGEDVGNAAIYATASQMSKISSILDSGVDFQPVIAPVVDLSHVYTGVNSIHSLMGQTYELANVNARMSAERDTSSLNDIASILNGLDFNSDNSDVVAAVSALSTDIMNLGVAIQGMRVQLGGKTVGVINSGLGQKQTMQNRGVSNG